MTSIIFLEHGGKRHATEVEDGQTVMQAAVNHLVPGILADCGGTCSCATCHAYVEAGWQDQLPPPSDDEMLMLEGALEQRPNSRLTCQLVVGPKLHGAVFQLPERQC